MRRITLWLVATVAVVVLLFSYHPRSIGASASGAAAPGVVTPGPVARSGSSSTSSGGSSSSSGSHASSKGSAPAVTVNGAVTDTVWGPVQVQVKISGNRIVEVRALTYPSGNGHDAAVNSRALPILRQQTLAAQSARIDGVSGATVTSDGYRESLQAALDAAHFNG